MDRYMDAYRIAWIGASNPRGIARAIVRMLDEAGEDWRHDPAICASVAHLLEIVAGNAWHYVTSNRWADDLTVIAQRYEEGEEE